MASNVLCKGTNSPQIPLKFVIAGSKWPSTFCVKAQIPLRFMIQIWRKTIHIPETTLQSLVLKYWDNEMISNLFFPLCFSTLAPLRFMGFNCLNSPAGMQAREFCHLKSMHKSAKKTCFSGGKYNLIWKGGRHKDFFKQIIYVLLSIYLQSKRNLTDLDGISLGKPPSCKTEGIIEIMTNTFW